MLGLEVDSLSHVEHVCAGRRSASTRLVGRLDVEAKLDDVAVGHHVVLALDPGLADGDVVEFRFNV